MNSKNNNIHNILQKNPLLLAPMAGATDLAFREIAREYGAYLCFSEMISAKALFFHDKKTMELLKTTKDDSPISIQIFGHEPDIMVYGAKTVENMGFDMIDINCGCPAPKIYKNGDGSSLMLNPHLIYKIVHDIRKSTNVTLSVKLRLGYDAEKINVVECAKICEEGGADFVTVHGRTRDMFYSGNCKKSYIKEVKDKLYIPLIANGDVTDTNSYQSMIDDTNCNGVMIGRAALGNPFVFSNILFPQKNITLEEKLNTMCRHIEKMCHYKGEGAIKESRTHLLYYLATLKAPKELKNIASKASTINDVYTLSKEVLKNAKMLN